MWSIFWKAKRAVVEAFGELFGELTEEAAHEAAKRLSKQLPHHDIEVRRTGAAAPPPLNAPGNQRTRVARRKTATRRR